MSFLKASILRIVNVEGLFVSVPCVFLSLSQRSPAVETMTVHRGSILDCASF